MNQSKELWLDIITKIQSVYKTENVVVAGGCVRDHLVQMDCKDIDVFTDIESELDLSFGIPALESFGFTDVRIFDIPDEAAADVERYNLQAFIPEGKKKPLPDGQSEMPALTGILEATYKGVPVQVMANPHENWSGESVISRFDYTRVQVWSDGEAIHETREAKRDRLKGSYTILKEIEETIKRVDRWQKRLPAHLKTKVVHHPKAANPKSPLKKSLFLDF